MDKTYTKEDISKMITDHQNALEKAVITIYQYQTADEQRSKETREHNGVGFSGADAGYLSYIAQYIIARQGHIQLGKILSGRHLDKTRSRMLKYSGQLAKIANKEM